MAWSVLGARTIRRRLSRFTLTAVGVALGIGVLFAVLITNATIDAGLDRLVGRQDEPRVQIQPTGGYEAEFPVSVADAAARVPGVVNVFVGTGVSLGIPDAPADKDRLSVTGGVERTGSAPPTRHKPKGADLVLRGRDAAAGTDEIVVTQAAADQLHAALGTSVRLNAPSGPVAFKVVGIRVRRDGAYVDGRWATTSYETAARLIGRPGFANFGTIQLAHRTDVRAWLADHANALGRSIQLSGGTIDADTLRKLLGTGKAALAGLAAIALFVSGFLIFLTLSTSVAESSAVHGTLRAIGASRAQVRRTVLGDAIALVALATPGGLVLGLASARATIALTRRAYGLPHLAVVTPWSAALVAIAVGVVVTLVAALVPARRAGRVAPVVAIRAVGEERRDAGRLWLVGLACIAAGLAIVLRFSQQRMDLGSFLVVAGAVLLVPAAIGPVASLAGKLTSRMARGVGPVGVLHLRKEPRRSAYTLALVMVVLAMGFATGAVHLSLRRNLNMAIASVFPADLAVFASAHFDAGLQDTVARTPGVRAAAPIWYTRTVESAPRRDTVDVTITDADKLFAMQTFPWSSGTQSAVAAALRNGGAVAIPDGLAREQHISVGDRMSLDTDQGARTFRVAGVFRSPLSRPPILAGARDGQRAFAVGPPNALVVSVDQGRDPAAVKAAIERASHGALFARLNSTEKANFIKGQTQFFNLVYALVLISLAMGTLGVANTLVMAVLRRTREIGILRAIGTERSLVRRMTIVESTTIAVAGVLLAIPLGLLLSYTVLQSVVRTTNTPSPYVFPWPMFFVVAPAALALAVLSGIAPSRHAARVDPARVLRFD